MGVLHRPTGTLPRRRNEVVLAVSRGPITFHHFATFFRDRLGCRDALYLDGNISRLHAPALGRDATGWFRDGHFIGILAVLPGPARAGSTPPRPRPRSR